MSLAPTEQVKKIVADIQDAVKTGFQSQSEKNAAQDRAIEDLNKAYADIRKMNLQSAEYQYESKSDRAVSKRYIRSDEEVRQSPNSFMKSSEGALQIKSAAVMRGREWIDNFGLLDDPEPKSEWQAELQKMVDQRSVIKLWSGNRPTPIMDARINDHMQSGPSQIQRIFSDSAGIGAEWIPDIMLPNLEKDLVSERVLSGLIDVVNMPSNSIQWPYMTVGPRPYIMPVGTTDDPAKLQASTMTTAQRTYAAVKLGVRMQVDRDSAEDSMIAAERTLREEMAMALIAGIEDAMVNGDTAATHQDAIASWDIANLWGASGLGGSNDHRRSWIGLRARAFDVSSATNANGSETVARLLAMRATLPGAYAGRPEDIVYVVNPNYLVSKLMGDSNIITIDKYGPNATLVTGEIGRLWGAPIIVSDFMSNDLAASGVYTGSGSQTGVICFNRRRFKMFMRRGNLLETDSDIARGTNEFVLTSRQLFGTTDSSSKVNVVYDYNMDV